MDNRGPEVVQQIGQAVSVFQQQCTGHAPQSVAVVLSGDMLLVKLQGALSLAELTLAQTREGAGQVQEFHRQLFANSADDLWREIERITGIEVREAIGEVAMAVRGPRALVTGTVVQVFLLAQRVAVDSSSGNGPNNAE